MMQVSGYSHHSHFKPTNFAHNSVLRSGSTSVDLPSSQERPSHRGRSPLPLFDEQGRPLTQQALSKTSLPTIGTCLCSPTNHPGSFRCHLHRDPEKEWPRPTTPRASIAAAVQIPANTTGLLRWNSAIERGTRRAESPVTPRTPKPSQNALAHSQR